MVNVILKAKTKKGREALRRGLEENTVVQRKLVKQWYEIKKVREKPFTLLVMIKTPLIAPLAVIAQLQDILKTNGAEDKKDYVVSQTEVVKK